MNLLQNFGLAQICFNQQLGIHHLPFGLMNNQDCRVVIVHTLFYIVMILSNSWQNLHVQNEPFAFLQKSLFLKHSLFSSPKYLTITNQRPQRRLRVNPRQTCQKKKINPRNSHNNQRHLAIKFNDVQSSPAILAIGSIQFSKKLPTTIII